MTAAVPICDAANAGSGPEKSMKSRVSIQFLPLALVAFAASGCNETSQPEAQQAVTVPCRCAAPVAAAPASVASATAPEARHFHRHHGYRWSTAHESSWSATWSESERSSSTVEYGYDESATHESRFEAETSAVRYSYWIDAYGRRHCYDRVQGREIAWQRAGDDRARLDPWHGYDGNDGPENGY
jgi:hypothetical protein